MGIETAIIGSALIGANSSRKASKAQAKGYDAATAEQRRQFDVNYADQAPYREAGTNALSEIGRLNTGDYSNFFTSPDYQFRLSEGNKAIDRNMRNLSGAQSKELVKYGSNLASGEYGNYYNRQAGQAGVGQTSVNQTGMTGANTANQIGSNMIGTGNARANAYQGYNQAVQGGMSNWMLNDYLNKPQGYQNTNNQFNSWANSGVRS